MNDSATRTFLIFVAIVSSGFVTTACNRGEESTRPPTVEAADQPTEASAAGVEGTAPEGHNAAAEATDPIGADARIVSTAGAITELVYALGASDSLVGVDVSSVYPPAAHQFPKVGYNRSLSSEGVVSLEPTHVLAGRDAGPAEALAQIEATGVRVLRFDDAKNITEGAALIQDVADALGRSEQGAELAATYEEDMTEARRTSTNDSNPAGVFIYARGADVMMIAGEATPADAMFELAGARNAARGFQDFRPLTPESIVAAAPEFIVVPARGLESLGGVDGLLRVPGVAQTPAAESRSVIAVDDLKFLGFGPRAPDAVRALNAELRELGLID